MRKRVIVTGGAGFLGRRVVADLEARGFDVVIVGRRDQGQGMVADLLHDDPKRIASAVSAEILIHLAWNTQHGVFWNAPDNLDWLAGTIRLVRAFKDAGGKRVLAVGTGAEFGVKARTADIDDNEDTDPISLYGITKDACRKVLETYAANEGLSFCWARIFMPYGPGEDVRRLIPATMAAMRRASVMQCSSGAQLRDVIHVEDAGRAISVLASSDIQGPVNIGSGETMRIREIVTLIAEMAGRPDLLHLGALQDRANDPPRLTVTATALHSIGFQTRISFRDGVKSMWDEWEPATG